jgi:hypothetical protein
MIYVEETLNLAHASYEALDRYIEFAREKLVPVLPELGARLIAALSSDEDWFCQVKQIMEFDDMEALKEFRINCSRSGAWGDYAAGLEEHAPVRHSRLLEPLGNAVPSEVLHKAIADSREEPNHGYLFAILEAANGQMEKLEAGLAESRKHVPIIASWRPISGSPNEVIDVWKSPEPRQKYEPADEWKIKFMRSVRLLAPKEKAVRLVALPFSPLQ